MTVTSAPSATSVTPTTSAGTAPGHSWPEQFAERRPALPGARLDWLDARRRQAIARFAELGWPSSRLEDWRHSSLSFLDQHPLHAPEDLPHPANTLARLRSAYDQHDHWLVFVDGRHEPSLSVTAGLPAGVELHAISTLLNGSANGKAPDELLEQLAANFGDADEGDSPQALNLALCSDGAFLRLPAGCTLNNTIHLVFIGATASSDRHLRNLILAGEHCVACVVEHHLGGGQTLSTTTTRIELGANARLDHLKFQQEAPEAIHVGLTAVRQQADSRFHSHSLSFGAKFARHDINTTFAGKGCETLLNGLYHVDGRRHVDHHTQIDHAQPHGTSHEYYRGLLDGSGRGVFRGRILVAKDAQRSDAIQRSDSLLLSKMAEADARPELEIYADDVKCAHGATIGQLDDDALFYLRSRGLDQQHAQQLLTYAFAAEVIERIEHEAARKQARKALLDCLPEQDTLEELQ